jgi:hypothetical protein
MTKEQEDSIEILENTDISTIELAENTDLYTYSLAVRTVLNMLKEKDAEIEKKDKMIDLMAEYISDLDIDEDICKKQSDNNCDDINREVECKECIKQYFEKQAKEKGE